LCSLHVKEKKNAQSSEYLDLENVMYLKHVYHDRKRYEPTGDYSDVIMYSSIGDTTTGSVVDFSSATRKTA
jgi:hypothetical protein